MLTLSRKVDECKPLDTGYVDYSLMVGQCRLTPHDVGLTALEFT